MGLLAFNVLWVRVSRGCPTHPPDLRDGVELDTELLTSTLRNSQQGMAKV